MFVDKHGLTVDSPICTDWSAFMAFNWDTMKPSEVRRKEVCFESGRSVLHEHPAGTTSSLEEAMRKLQDPQGVVKVPTDACSSGFKSVGNSCAGPVVKPIGFCTNPLCNAQGLNKKCQNRMASKIPEEQRHRHHVILLTGRAKVAEAYPDEFCKAICSGIKAQSW